MYPNLDPPISYSPIPHGMEIFNRVFVGGLAYNTTELELKNSSISLVTYRTARSSPITREFLKDMGL